MKALTGISADDSHTLVYWKLTDWCNFRCSYCPPKSHLGKMVPLQPDLSTLRTFCHSLNELSESGKKIELVLSGGEPTVHPHFADVINAINEKIMITVITNGSRQINWWKNLEKLPDGIIISIHQSSNLSKIKEISDFIICNGKNVIFNCSMDANDWDGSVKRFETMRQWYGYRALRKIINDLDENGRQSSPQFLTEKQQAYMTVPDDFTDPFPENTAYFKAMSYDAKLANDVELIFDDQTTMRARRPYTNGILSRHQLNYFKGWLCSAGRQSVSIEPNGDVMAGICLAKKIGHISDFKLEKDPIICTKTLCACPGDFSISKKYIPGGTLITSTAFDINNQSWKKTTQQR